MSRNFGLGSRDMEFAGALALKKEMQSFSSIATMAERWGQFAKWAKAIGINRLEHIQRADVILYGEDLADRVERGEMKAATAQNYISAINRVMRIARDDKEVWVSPTKHCGIPERSGIAKESKALPEAEHNAALLTVSIRLGALLCLQRMLGQRFEESAKFDVHAALKEALQSGTLLIKDGTKGGCEREVPIWSECQIAVLQRAGEIQGGDRSMIPANQRYAEFQREAYKEATAAKIHFHAERHHYAQIRYQMLACCLCPVQAGVAHGQAHFDYMAKVLGVPVAEARKIDREARLVVAQELGHHRVEITNAYLG